MWVRVCLLCSPEHFASTHTHTLAETCTIMRSTAACPHWVCKWRCTTMVYNVKRNLPATPRHILTYMHRMLQSAAARGKRSVLGSPFREIKTASDAAHLRSICHQCPGLEAGFSLCSACLCILLPQRYSNTIQLFNRSRASLEWSNDIRESSV